MDYWLLPILLAKKAKNTTELTLQHTFSFLLASLHVKFSVDGCVYKNLKGGVVQK